MSGDQSRDSDEEDDSQDPRLDHDDNDNVIKPISIDNCQYCVLAHWLKYGLKWLMELLIDSQKAVTQETVSASIIPSNGGEREVLSELSMNEDKVTSSHWIASDNSSHHPSVTSQWKREILHLLLFKSVFPDFRFWHFPKIMYALLKIFRADHEKHRMLKLWHRHSRRI